MPYSGNLKKNTDNNKSIVNTDKDYMVFYMVLETI